MSASLVGSEMCIRDSERQRAMGPAGGRRDERLGAFSQNPWRRPRPRAVSYTHLTLPTICSV
eukprot:1869795-Alexandrium_andersonii.AAC.1